AHHQRGARSHLRFGAVQRASAMGAHQGCPRRRSFDADLANPHRSRRPPRRTGLLLLHRRPQPARGGTRAPRGPAAGHPPRPGPPRRREVTAEPMSQPRLFEFRMGERSPSTLVVTEANRDAAKLLTAWRSWPSGALALIGPKGAGKTHLALAWALEAGARQ